MSVQSIGIKIWGDLKDLTTALNKGKTDVTEFTKGSEGAFRNLSATVKQHEATIRDLSVTYGKNSVQVKQAQAALVPLKNSLQDASEAARGTSTKFSGLQRELSGVLAGYIGITAVASGVVSFFKGAIEGAAGDERAERRLSNSLNGSIQSYESLISYKDQMMESTLFSEDEIMGAITMGTELGRTEEQTKKMVETAMGLSNVTGQDLNTAMMQLSATFDGNIGKLGKFAPALKDLTDKQLANGEGVEILNQRFGKLATEGLSTVEGRVAQTKKKFEELSDSIGTAILKVLGFNAIKDETQMGKMTKQEQADISAFSSMGKDEQKSYLAGWQSQQDNYFKALNEAKAKGDEVNRTHLSIQFADTKTFVDKLKVIYSQVPKQSKEDLQAGLSAEKKEWEDHVRYMKSLAGELTTVTASFTQAGLGINTEKATSIGMMGRKQLSAMSPVANSANQPGSVDGGVKASEALQDIRNSIEATSASLSGLGSGFQNMFSSLGDTFIKFKEGFKGGWKEIASSIGAVMQSAVSFVSDLFTQQSADRIAKLDETYNAERERIEGSKMNEDRKKKALEKLDKDTQKQKKALMRENAKDQKEASIMQAVIAGALGVIQAMSAPFPLDIIMPVLIGAMAAVQIANIISTPLPALANGGLAYGPTVAQIGEYPGASSNPEVIAPLDKLRGMIGGGGNGGVLEARVKGEDLLFVLDRAKTAKNRRYGS